MLATFIEYILVAQQIFLKSIQNDSVFLN
uniref:Uncharacterized protein n=1 Tax=Rhizophora mucronata TaxID=61149 RepID=A0A2P2P3A9_RHIMU